MGFDFIADREDVEDFHLGAFSWRWMLDSGAGLVLGYGPGVKAWSYFYELDETGQEASPVSSDGYHVTAARAAALALALRGLVSVQTARNACWAALAPEMADELRIANERSHLYRETVRQDFLDKAAAMAAWAERSGGFRIR